MTEKPTYDEEVRVALGLNKDGTCFRHPNQTIISCSSSAARNGTSTTTSTNGSTANACTQATCRIHTCRICDSELHADNAITLRHRKSFHLIIQQVQKLHNNKEQWNAFKENWGDIEEEEGGGGDDDEEGKDRHSTHTASTSSSTTLITGTRRTDTFDIEEHNRQFAKRAIQVSDWAIERKDQEVQSLRQEMNQVVQSKDQEIQALARKQDEMQSIIDALQAQVEKQEKMINQDLKVIKVIAMKRAIKSPKARRKHKDHHNAGSHPESDKSSISNSDSSSKSRRKQTCLTPSSQSPVPETVGEPGEVPEAQSNNKKIFEDYESRELSSGTLSMPPQEAPPRLPTRKQSTPDDLSLEQRHDLTEELAIVPPELVGATTGGSQGTAEAPRLPIRRSSHQPTASPSGSTNRKFQLKFQTRHRSSPAVATRKVSFSETAPSPNSDPPNLPRRQVSTNDDPTITDPTTTGTGYDTPDIRQSPTNSPHSSSKSPLASAGAGGGSGTNSPNINSRGPQQRKNSLTRPPRGGGGAGSSAGSAGSGGSSNREEVHFVPYDSENNSNEDNSLSKRNQSEDIVLEDLLPGRKNSSGRGVANKIDRLKQFKREGSQEIAFIPTESEIFNSASIPLSDHDIERLATEHLEGSAKFSNDSLPPPPPPISSPPPPPPPSSSEGPQQQNAEITVEFRDSHKMNAGPPSSKPSSHEIRFDASHQFAARLDRQGSEILNMRFDESQPLLLEASQAITSTTTPVSVRKQTPAMTKPRSNRDIHLGGASPALTARSKKNGAEQEIKLGGFKDDQQQLIYGTAAMAEEQDELDDNYDYFGEDLVLPSGLNLNSQRMLECPERSISPVSALTTGSYLLDTSGMKFNDDDDDDDNELEGLPRKALHGGGKVLPNEQDFNSLDTDDDDDDDNNNNEIHHNAKNNGFVGVAKGGNNNDGFGVPSGGHHHHPHHHHHLHHTLNFQKQSATTGKNTHAAPGAPQQHQQLRSPELSRSKDGKTYHVEAENVQDKYGDGGEFTGSVSIKDNLPHGYGKMKYDNDRRYEGHWRDGRWHGYGRWLNPNGDCYEGSFVYDARHGKGTYTWKNGNVYRGDFFEDKRQGKGTFSFANGNVYEGDFVNGVFEGVGRYDFEGGYYEGQWKAGRYHGNGFLLFADGSSYRGEFLDGVAHGQGEETCTEGSVRKGYWENGKPIGAATG